VPRAAFPALPSVALGQRTRALPRRHRSPRRDSELAARLRVEGRIATPSDRVAGPRLAL